MTQSAEYFSHFRADVLAHVPESARNVLSLGCGGARTEAELVKRGAHVLGIEPFEPAARVAEGRGIEILVGDHATTAETIADRKFDCLIYADVLEHIRTPEDVLATHIPLLSPGGTVIISVPNFRHYSVLQELFVRGEPPYAEAGIFDRTHVRLTTRKLVQRWLTDEGIIIDHAILRPARKRDRIISRLFLGGLREFLAYQVIMVGHKPIVTTE